MLWPLASGSAGQPRGPAPPPQPRVPAVARAFLAAPRRTTTPGSPCRRLAPQSATGRWWRRVGEFGALGGGREGAPWREEAVDGSGETRGEVSAGVVGREAPRLIRVSLP